MTETQTQTQAQAQAQTSRIAARFAACRAQGRAALVGYLTAYDPDRDASLAHILAACEAGLDVLELGVPFSDPTADGAEIQAAMVRALAAGATFDGALDLARAVRERFPDLPIVLFGYANPLLRAAGRLAEDGAGGGEAQLCRALAEVVDGLLVVDLPPEEAAILREPARAAGLDWIALSAPTSPPARRDRLVAGASGFIYAVSLTGVTGAALDASSEGVRAQIEDLRGRSELPVAVGFGVREPEQVAVLAQLADGVVVGSALVRAAKTGSEALAAKVQALRGACSRS
ncbi:tryptophan synthase, alpha subunit [Plesiocystis pacifica SIR-1]|uniref:Tryptophan synthase alpha chain n=1 Tax=Plesiocystis pacifica SIR-1 TaxID=391625 RepID=A6G758_9BACT|nr:tryptophan synthase subunit alpha [Plesiocystis pacifica]EDM78334.1 tryptophan synthase, alpha subunit [Plesiocystis pacifica SIR-1]